MSAAPRPRPSAATLVRAGRPVPSSRSGRYVLSQDQWAAFAERLDSDPLHLSGLWSDGAEIHALLLESADSPLIASVAVERQRFLALSPMRASAILPERIVRDLWGIEAMAARDLRPWLDHSAWGLTAPLAARPGPASWPPEPPEFLWDEEDEAAGAFQLPIGPVQTLTIGPAQFRLTLVGERIRRNCAQRWRCAGCSRTRRSVWWPGSTPPPALRTSWPSPAPWRRRRGCSQVVRPRRCVGRWVRWSGWRSICIIWRVSGRCAAIARRLRGRGHCGPCCCRPPRRRSAIG
jgi:hypothetical protein